MSDTNIDYIVIGSEINGPEEKGMINICTRISEKGVSDNVLLYIKAIQAKFAEKVEKFLKESVTADNTREKDKDTFKTAR